MREGGLVEFCEGFATEEGMRVGREGRMGGGTEILCGCSVGMWWSF